MSETNPLHVHIQSFSYKSGIPQDESGHGGGFVFDCRFIYNPGREVHFKELTGRDWEVVVHLDENAEMQEFLEHVRAIVGKAVARYIQRDFDYLSIRFGCTGGQHRSVYAAESTCAFIAANYPVRITLEHVEQNRLRGWETKIMPRKSAAD